MGLDPTFQMKKYDTRPELAITITDELTGNALDLTGASAKFYLRPEKGGTIKIDGGTATIYGAAAGKVKYTWVGTADTNTPGRYLGEFEITLAGGGIVTFPQNGYIQIHILEGLG